MKKNPYPVALCQRPIMRPSGSVNRQKAPMPGTCCSFTWIVPPASGALRHQLPMDYGVAHDSFLSGDSRSMNQASAAASAAKAAPIAKAK